MSKTIIEAINCPPTFQFSTDTPELRLYATQAFVTSDGQIIGQGNPFNNESWYLAIPCMVQPTGILYVPGFEIDSTTDGQPRTAKYIAALFTEDGAYIGPMPSTNPSGFAIPPPDLMPAPTWGQLAIYNRLPTLLYPPITFAPRDEMYAAIAAAIGQQDNASSTNKGVTALTTDPFDPTFPIAVSASDPDWLAVAGGIPDASATVKGITELDVDPVDATIPIAVGVNSDLLGLNNERVAWTSTVAVVNGDKNKTIALGGNDCYALIFAAASGFDANFMVIVLNEDSDRAKIISIDGLSDFFLYPGQTAIIYNQNDVWQVYKNNRWKCPSGTVVYVATDGSDTNDGLTFGAAGALQTPQAAINKIKADFDLANVGATSVVVQLADGTYTSAGRPVILADGPFFGYQPTTVSFPSTNEPPVSIRGNAVNPENVILHNTGTVLGSVLAIVGACIGVQDVKITSASGNGLHVAQAVLFFGNVILGACGASKIFLSHSSVIENYDNWFIEGNSANVISANYLSAAYIVGHTLTLLSDMTVTEFALAARNSDLTFQDTIDDGGFTVTGKRFTIHSGAAININSSLGPAQFDYFPGTTDGTLFGFGSYDTSDTTRSPIDVSANEIKLGSDSGVFTRTNNTLKVGHLALPPYADASLDFFPVALATSATDNVIGVGGGGTGAASTLIRLITAANNNTATGTDRVTIDNTGLVSFLSGLVSMISLPAFANNAAATGGGLAVGRLYRTGGDPDTVCVVH